MARPLVDLLWRDHPAATGRGARGPRARGTTGAVVDAALALADADGLPAVTVRRLGGQLDASPMSVYTHVNSRDDLLVLIADAAHARMARPDFGRRRWRTRVRLVAEANLGLYRAHPWLLEIADDRVALGPGTIAKYDHELHAFDALELDDVVRDAALTFVLDFVRASGRAQLVGSRAAAEPTEAWATVAPRLAGYVGDDFPLARRVGGAAGEAMQGAYSPRHAWRFGLARVLDGLATMT
jgi:AcrR family transcriptional regulator